MSEIQTLQAKAIQAERLREQKHLSLRSKESQLDVRCRMLRLNRQSWLLPWRNGVEGDEQKAGPVLRL